MLPSRQQLNNGAVLVNATASVGATGWDQRQADVDKSTTTLRQPTLQPVSVLPDEPTLLPIRSQINNGADKQTMLSQWQGAATALIILVPTPSDSVAASTCHNIGQANISQDTHPRPTLEGIHYPPSNFSRNVLPVAVVIPTPSNIGRDVWRYLGLHYLDWHHHLR
jgi:hypothetical protein